MSGSTLAPGVYRQESIPPSPAALPTGVPLFLGHAASGPPDTPVAVSSVAGFDATFAADPAGGFLADAVGAFFANGGGRCVVVRLGDDLVEHEALARGLAAAADAREPDLVGAPDIMRRPAGMTADAAGVLALQNMLLAD